MSDRADAQPHRHAPAPIGAAPLPPAMLLERRRDAAARVRRRRMLLADVALGVGLAVLCLALGPGLAIVAILALAVLAACGVSILYGRLRARRARRERKGAVGLG